MMTLYLILWVIAVILFGSMVATTISEFVTTRRSHRREGSRIFSETLRAERKLHHLASDAFFSMMEVARSSENARESRDDEVDNDVN